MPMNGNAYFVASVESHSGKERVFFWLRFKFLNVDTFTRAGSGVTLKRLINV